MPENPKPLSGKVILITGASRGIGAATAKAFAAEGARVAINARREASLRDLRESMKRVDAGDHVIAPGDMAVPADVDRVMHDSLAALGGLDVLICNAGIMIRKPLRDLTLEEWSSVLGTNLTSTYLLARAAEPLLRKARGAIVTMSRGSLMLARRRQAPAPSISAASR